ncbi:MAG: hypothetical protein FWG06_01725 [Clostridiales bacterium]|nr:hypothetical protein [Clostridiales bacterium]
MASEQAFYALVSLQRFFDGQNSLYRMTEEPQAQNVPADALRRLPEKRAGNI